MPKVKGRLRKLAKIDKLSDRMDFYREARHFLSFGGGVQSWTLFNKSIREEIPFPIEAAIFADTGWEREQTYECVERARELGEEHGIPVLTVRSGNIYEDTLNPEVRAPGMPFYVRPLPISVEEQREKAVEHLWQEDGILSLVDLAEKLETEKTILEEFDLRVEKGEIQPIVQNRSVMLQRQCTGDYKIKPVRKKLRQLEPESSFKKPVVLWIGITTDEIGRMKPADVKWVHHRFPLIEQRLSREDCYKYLRENDLYFPVKSSCIGCPFHTAVEWADLNEEEFESACQLDEGIRHQGLTHPTRAPMADDRLFLHRDLKALCERPFERQLVKKVASPKQLSLLGIPPDDETGGCDSYGCWT